MVENCLDMFEDAPVKGFCNSVMLRSVVGGEVVLSALLLKELGECMAGVLTATV
jgi:hypothetical protein